MTTTLEALLGHHGEPLVPLADLCERYFGINARTAREKAALNQLPVPAWRLLDTPKAPYMVLLRDLANYIDSQADAQRLRWERSQI